MTGSPTPPAPPDLPRPSAILFDWDDTLVDNWSCIAAALNAARQRFDLPVLSVADTKRLATRSLRDSFPVMFGDGWREARDIFSTTFDAQHISHLRVLAGAEDVLLRLSATGMPMAVVSNKNGNWLRQEVAHLAWNRHFCSIVGAGDAAADKPSGAPALLALQDTGCAADRSVWLVGDTVTDMACAQNAGCSGILVGPQNVEQPLDLAPAATISSVAALLELATAAGTVLAS